EKAGNPHGGYVITTPDRSWNDKSLNYVERTVKLLRAASQLTGGDAALASRLGIREQLLQKIMTGRYELPRQLLLQTVDILLEGRESGADASLLNPRHHHPQADV